MDHVIRWLLKGDPAIRWQVLSDLLCVSREEAERERARVAHARWGRQLLALQGDDGQWGSGLYTPKWTSTTYTLLLLRALGLIAGNRRARAGALLLLDAGAYRDGGINLWLPWRKHSETCGSCDGGSRTCLTSAARNNPCGREPPGLSALLPLTGSGGIGRRSSAAPACKGCCTGVAARWRCSRMTVPGPPP